MHALLWHGCRQRMHTHMDLFSATLCSLQCGKAIVARLVGLFAADPFAHQCTQTATGDVFLTTGGRAFVRQCGHTRYPCPCHIPEPSHFSGGSSGRPQHAQLMYDRSLLE
jgi:hypothetical protein